MSPRYRADIRRGPKSANLPLPSALGDVMPLGRKAPSLPSGRQTTSIEDLRNENRRLTNDLFVARHALVILMDPQDWLSGYFRIRDFDQLAVWRDDAAQVIIKEAWIRPGEEMGDPRWPRAICPLCRRGAQGTRDVKGYAVPAGLRRHLLGELNSRQCPVFAAAESIARDSIQEALEGGLRPRLK
jgi:hypothetical protein